MLTTENQLADPSSSSRSAPLLKADGQRVSDADPNFSIRGYAFASRSKDIRTSWPFPQKLLQLCFKHGIRDSLPPFEPPDSVRLQCQKKTADLEEDGRVAAQVGSHEITDVCSDYVVPSDKVVLETQYPSRKEEKLMVEKKSKLVLKLSPNSQARRIDQDIASTSSTVSDPMASKVCPVCKLFSSPSNTTLNAHMDQCLSVESNDILTRSTNPRVKPRKKRLMVDIYATAPHCTLEELDRRNGTTWARDLALVAVPGGEPPPMKTKRPRLSPVGFRHDGDEAVYVDSNGIKLRILSKSSDMPPPVMPKEESKLRKHAAEFSEGKSTQCNKNKPFGSKILKHMKVKHMSKKLISFNMPRIENEAQAAKDYQDETHKEKKEALSAVVALNDIQKSGRATLGQWACSKRSVLHKKMEKATHKCSENQELLTKRPMLQSDQSDLCGPSGMRTHTNSSRSIGDFRSSPKTKRVYFLETMINKKGSPSPHVKEKLSSGSTSTNGPRLKLSSSCHTSRNTGGEHLSSTQKSDNVHQRTARSLDNCHMSMKAKKIVSMRKHILVRRPSFPLEEKEKDDTGEIAPKAFRKRRSKLVTAKRGGELPTDVNGTSKKEPLEAEGDDTMFTLNSMDKVDADRISSDTGSHEEPTAHPVYDKNGLTSFDVLKEIASPADVQVADELELRGEEVDFQDVFRGESQAEAVSAQESSACLTSHGASDGEPSFSPGSTASTISTLLPKVRNSKDLEAEEVGRISENTGDQARGREIKYLKISRAREPDHRLSDTDQPCCCSRREGLSTEFPSFATRSSVPGTTFMPSRGKQMSSLFIAPQPYSFAPYSSVNFPAYGGLGSNSTFPPSQSPYTPISVLRLMGKDLMVHNEPGKPSVIIPLPASLGFAPARTVSNQESFRYSRNQLQTGSSIAAASHQFPMYAGLNAKSVHQPHPKKFKKKPDPPMTSARTRDTAPAMESTLPSIAGSNLMAQQRPPFSCFPSHSRYVSRDVSGGLRPVYPKPFPRELANPGKSTEGRLRPLLPSPIFFRSTSSGHLGRPVYYYP